MSGNMSPTSAGSASNWEQLFECALLERDPVVREQRLQNAKDAIMGAKPGTYGTLSSLNFRAIISERA